jgi:hypothetical protein
MYVHMYTCAPAAFWWAVSTVVIETHSCEPAGLLTSFLLIQFLSSTWSFEEKRGKDLFAFPRLVCTWSRWRHATDSSVSAGFSITWSGLGISYLGTTFPTEVWSSFAGHETIHNWLRNYLHTTGYETLHNWVWNYVLTYNWVWNYLQLGMKLFTTRYETIYNWVWNFIRLGMKLYATRYEISYD